ncbi:MAG: PhnD/SsuA/transferrin family substrate-binding protein [Gammaproteobacteria bacterium]
MLIIFQSRVFKCLGLFAIGLIWYFSGISVLHAQDIKIALRTNRGTTLGLNEWQPTADYLNRKLPGYHFVIVPFDMDSALNQAVSRGKYDFVFTDSAAYVELNIRYGTIAIATLINKDESSGKAYSRFGSVIFTRADRNDISSFRDLKDKTFMAVDEQGFGGWRIAWRALLSRGVDPYRDFKLLSFAGGIQQDVVFAVRDRDVDAGCVRTDILERMAKHGDISMDTFKVLEPRNGSEMAFIHSTRLYPEWPFARLKHTSTELANKVATALISMSSDEPAAIAGHYAGWSKPLDYRPVDELLQALVTGPYETSLYAKSKQLISNYRAYFIGAMALFVTAILTTIVIAISNRRLTTVKQALELENAARQKAQRELENHQQHLEDTVNERTAKLQAHIRELESYSYSIAHDLRTPLRAIVSFSQILEQEASAKLNTVELDALHRIEQAGKHMAALIDDILELSRITRTQVNKTTVNLSSICRDIADELQNQDPERTVHWKISDNINAMADTSLMTLLLQNLLDNAWKYTRDEKSAVIEFAIATELGKDQLTPAEVDIFFIRDNGIGFDMKYKDKIFQPFQRLHTGGFEGTGIGLATVQRIMQRHGGNIWIESQPGMGTTVYFSLPRSRP